MDEDPLVFLQNCSTEDIMTFLKWLHDNYRIKKLDSSHEYKRIFLMLYRRCVGYSLHAKIAYRPQDHTSDGLPPPPPEKSGVHIPWGFKTPWGSTQFFRVFS